MSGGKSEVGRRSRGGGGSAVAYKTRAVEPGVHTPSRLRAAPQPQVSRTWQLLALHFTSLRIMLHSDGGETLWLVM